MYTISDSYEEISLDPRTFSDATPKKSKIGQGACAICGAKPTGINFDVLTCSSCKAFFRRNGVKPLHQFVCRSSNNCKIDERSRRQCTACRLQKCFAMGMIKERIRTEEQNQRHRALVEENRRQKMKRYQEQQTENRSKVLDVRRCRRRPALYSSSSSCSASTNRSDDIDSIFDLFLENSQEIASQDFHFQFDHDLTDVLNSYCTPMTCLIAFFKQLYPFQQLPIDDRLLLLKHNMKVLLPILTHLLSATFGVQISLNQPGPHRINHKLSSAYSLFAYIIPEDDKLLLLLLVVFLFSPCLFTNDALLDAGQITSQSAQLIRRAYDEYTQLLWLYLLEKSLENVQQAVLTYTKIVTRFLQLQNHMSEVYDVIQCSVQIDRLHMMMQSILHLT